MRGTIGLHVHYRNVDPNRHPPAWIRLPPDAVYHIGIAQRQKSSKARSGHQVVPLDGIAACGLGHAKPQSRSTETVVYAASIDPSSCHPPVSAVEFSIAEVGGE